MVNGAINAADPRRSYDAAGTYVVTALVARHRDGDVADPHRRLQKLASARRAPRGRRAQRGGPGGGQGRFAVGAAGYFFGIRASE